ncbi:NAD(P)/FAD-dependent oxidoreductase [Dermacoccaceae bacterium W4C1]
MSENQTIHTEVVVIGGGPAGLQAALTLGRVHRQVVLLDSGVYRNDPASHLHNLISRDGTPPAQLRALARQELAHYPWVRVLDAAATAVRDESQATSATAWVTELAGGRQVRSRAIVLATGLRDELPQIPGLAQAFGSRVAHCPFCHGHEFAGGRIAVLGAAAAGHLVPLLTPIAGELLALGNGEPVPDLGVAKRSEPVTRVRETADGLLIDFADGGSEQVQALFTPTTLHQGAPFAEQLGLACNDSGAIRIDARGHTSRRGIYAAGDLAHVPELPMPTAAVPQAIGAGANAGAAVVGDLVTGVLG